MGRKKGWKSKMQSTGNAVTPTSEISREDLNDAIKRFKKKGGKIKKIKSICREEEKIISMAYNLPDEELI